MPSGPLIAWIRVDHFTDVNGRRPVGLIRLHGRLMVRLFERATCWAGLSMSTILPLEIGSGVCVPLTPPPNPTIFDSPPRLANWPRQFEASPRMISQLGTPRYRLTPYE
jgi:hypothetical protein